MGRVPDAERSVFEVQRKAPVVGDDRGFVFLLGWGAPPSFQFTTGLPPNEGCGQKSSKLTATLPERSLVSFVLVARPAETATLLDGR